MMKTKEEALQEFFDSFGIMAFTSASVPDDVVFPWLTYDLAIGAWEDGEISITVDLWYRTESEAVPNAKAREIGETIGMGGKIIPCDGGAIWLKRGSPWSQSISDDRDPYVKRRMLNLSAEYITQN